METVYKSCRNYIIYLQKLPDTITNEGRNGIKNAQYATYGGNKFLVTKIKHKITDLCISELKTTDYYDTRLYKVGCEIIDPNFNPNVHYSLYFCNAIHYVKDETYAKNYEVCDWFSGISVRYDYDGIMVSEEECKDGKLNGKSKQYSNTGVLIVEREYKDGKLDGMFKSYYSNGNPREIANYKDNKVFDKFISYHSSGKIRVERPYNNVGILDGSDITYYTDGTIMRLKNYKNGKLDGEYRKYVNKKLAIDGFYTDGKKTGTWTINYNI